MIPDEAIEAAHKAWREQAKQDGSIFEYNLRAALEAAAPFMLLTPGVDDGIHESRTVDAMVEAVARALHARECTWNDWDAIHPHGGSYVVKARTALEAASAQLAVGPAK